MRLNKYIFSAYVMIAALFWACEKELDTEGLSRVTNFAQVTLKGEPLTVLKVGDAYTELGAEANENGQSIDVQISGTVNTNEPGIYAINYAATNEDGFTSTRERVIAVLPPTLPAEVLNTDLSGTYERVGNKQIVNITKIADGLYQVDNFGGVAPPSSAIFPAYILHVSATELVIPEQPSPSGPVTGIDAVVEGESVSWRVINPGFGDALRTFIRVKPPSIRYE